MKVTRRAVVGGLLGVILAGGLAGLYGAVIEAGARLRVQRWALQPALWPRGQRLRIVMVADLHAGAPQMPKARIRRIVDLANAQGGDLVLLMGDYRASHRFQTRPIPIEASAPLLARLRAPLGVHAILGNHDWWDDDAAQARRKGPTRTESVLQAAGINVLVNRAQRLGEGAASFWLAGLDSQRALMPLEGRPAAGRDDLGATLAMATDDAPLILLAHEPDIFATQPRRVCLTLSGHTHGGQIRLGNWTPVVPSRYGARYAYGHIRERDRDLVVSGGLGFSGIPIRIGRPPEITVLDLS